MVQVMLNLVKNAAEALGSQPDAEIHMSTAFRSGVRLAVPGSPERVSLPLEIAVRDNGPGIVEDMLPFLFDPFITTKPTGSGLGLALVAKIIRDHGGIVECVRQPRGTLFRLLLPIAPSRPIAPPRPVIPSPTVIPGLTRDPAQDSSRSDSFLPKPHP
jgi:two-component system, NtrC family, nitrogen regulation sensor histidine kinase GlnL